MVVVLTWPVAVSMATIVAHTGVPMSLAVLCHAVAYLQPEVNGRHMNQDATVATAAVHAVPFSTVSRSSERQA